MVPSSYNCTHACDFSHGNTHFYNVSEVQIHASHKYDNTWVAKVHAWVVLITTRVLYVPTTREYTVIITQACAIAKNSTSTKHTHDCYIVTIVIVVQYYYTACVEIPAQWLTCGLNQPCTGKETHVVHLGLCMVTNARLKLLYCKWPLGFKTTLGDTRKA